MAAVAHSTSRGLLACLPDALYVLILHGTDYQIAQTQRGGMRIFFPASSFFKGKGEFFLNPNHFWLFLLLLFLRCFVCF